LNPLRAALTARVRLLPETGRSKSEMRTPFALDFAVFFMVRPPESKLYTTKTLASTRKHYHRVGMTQSKKKPKTPPGQLTIRIAPAVLKQIDAFVADNQKTNPFVKRIDILREVINAGIAVQLDALKATARSR
jgi:hypothetical protein